MSTFLVTETIIETGTLCEVTQYKCAGLRVTVQSDLDHFTIYTDNDAANPVATLFRPTRNRPHWHAYDLDGSEIEHSSKFGPRGCLRRTAKLWHADSLTTKLMPSQSAL